MRVLVPLVLLASFPSLAICENPYFGNKPGSVFRYRDGAGHSTRMTVKAADGDRLTIESSVGTGEAQTSHSFDARCTSKGLVVDTDALMMRGGRHQPVGATVKTLRHEGVMFPSKLRVGDSWTERRTTEMARTGGHDMTMTVDITTVHRVAGRETVRVKAGEFDALRIESDATMEMKMVGADAEKMKGHLPHGGTVTHSSVWVAKGVGLVKSMHGEAPNALTSELESYSVP